MPAAALLPASPRRAARGRAVAIMVVVALVAAASTAAATRENATLEYRVKAAYLLNFARYVRWPAESFSDPEAPVVIGIFGEDPFGQVLDETVRGRTAEGRTIEVRRYARLEEVRRCHVLFLAAGVDEERRATVLRTLRGLPILTVGESEDFLATGGILRLFIYRDTVRFAVNLEVARAVGLEISSQMLRLAETVVYERPEER